jgi:hypothetical protein
MAGEGIGWVAVQQAAWHSSQPSSASLDVGLCAIFTHHLSGLLNRGTATKGCYGFFFLGDL